MSVRPALLVLVASSTAVFIATPFLLRPIATEFEVSLGVVGWASTSQLAGFVLASWLAGRLLRPVRPIFVAICLIGLTANMLSAFAPNLASLAGTRMLSGVSLGLAAWFAWQDAFGDSEKTGDVAVTGPLVGVVLAPGIAALLDIGGIQVVFFVLAAVAAAPLLFVGQVPTRDRLRPHRTRHAATRAARAILLSLSLITMAGSSVFVYAAAIGTEFNDLSPFVVSLVFSANALVSIPAAKWSGPRGPAGLWFCGTAALSFVVPAVHVPIVFITALVSWGFVFFMGIPAAFGLLASRSRFPEERAGDAQAVMALGRVAGPLIGGAFIGSGATTKMGLAASVIMLSAAALLLYVERDRFSQ
ncbi:MAG: putative MFS family arabinose efflux permease [Candidatus Aldehydirespiratoraceae bacterium]